MTSESTGEKPALGGEENRRNTVAVDVGGTFTDLVMASGHGLTALKVPSTPSEPERAVLDAIGSVGGTGLPVIHGSTVATNSLLERRGARTALVTTRGFADVLEIGRQERQELYRLEVSGAEPLVVRRLRFELDERVIPGGEVLVSPRVDEVDRLVDEVLESGAESVAVCLLFSYENPRHEELLAEALRGKGLNVSLSTWVLPEYREYERTSTTVINAYVSPVMEQYLDRLESSLEGSGPGSRIRLMHSAGGTVSSGLARRRAVDLVLSGPAGGVVAARRLGETLGLDRIISFDMGGTSTDVSLIDGDFIVSRETRISGLPVSVPMIDIHTIGAGGGSIAFRDRAGVLKVGPRSAGADPGPACYGKSGLPTVTDANLLLGRLDPDWFLGGRMRLDPEMSRGAFSRLTGGGDLLRAADATVEVALSHMEAAVKKVSLSRGHDPRDFTLAAFGGAGPMHACQLAERLEIPRVVVPVFPGLFSSVGMMLALPGRDYSRTVFTPLDQGCADELRGVFDELRRTAAAEMAEEGYEESGLDFERRLQMRYRGQSHDVTVRVESLEPGELKKGFEREYHDAYGYLRRGRPVEVVTAQLVCRASGIGVPALSAVTPGGVPGPVAEKTIYFKRPLKGRSYRREGLDPGEQLDGPALVLQEDATTVIPPGWTATVESRGNLLLEVEDGH